MKMVMEVNSAMVSEKDVVGLYVVEVKLKLD